MTVAAATALAWTLSLPGESPDLSAASTAHQVFHLDWFLASTGLGYLIWRAAGSSWRLGIASIILPSLQVLAIADEGAHRLHHVGVVSAQTDLLYVAAVLQVVSFVAIGASGIRRNLADRRWARLVGRLEAMDSPPARRAL